MKKVMLIIAVVFAASCGQSVSTQNEASETSTSQGDSTVVFTDITTAAPVDTNSAE